MRSERLKAEIAFSEKLCLGAWALAATIVSYLFTQWDQASQATAFVCIVCIGFFLVYGASVYLSINEALEALENAD